MKLKNLHIENIRSYKDLDIAFEDGVTVISGVNGSGKSSLLEACFMGLFGSKILSKDFVLADMVFKGAENAAIVLDFEHLGRDYTLEQRFHYSLKSENAVNSKCVLYADGESVVDQTVKTYEEVCSLLNMDEDAYRNCAYIRQGEIDVLINAKPKDRQRMIDDLLQLGKLEEYRERVSSAKTGVKRLERDTEKSIDSVLEEITAIQAIDPVSLLNGFREQVKKLDFELRKLNDKKDYTGREKEKMELMLSQYREWVLEKEKLRQAVEEVFDKKGKCNLERAECNKSIHELDKTKQGIEEENAVLREKFGFGDAEIGVVLHEKEREEAAAREKVSAVSKELALARKEAQNQELALKDLEAETEKSKTALLKCRSEIEAANAGALQNEEKIRSLEGANLEIREKAGCVNRDILDLVKEREAEERRLLDRKNEIAAKLSLAIKEKESLEETQKILETDVSGRRASLQKCALEIQGLEAKLRDNAPEALKLRGQKSGALEALKKLGYDEEKLGRLEELGELLLENKNRLHGNAKETETKVKELDKNIRKNRDLLAAGKCPTCGQELKGSELAGTLSELENEKQKLLDKLLETKALQEDLEIKLGDLKEARKLEKKISDLDGEAEKLKSSSEASEKLVETYKVQALEHTEKLSEMQARVEELESRNKQVLLEIEDLKAGEEAAKKAHLQGESSLLQAKEAEKKLADNSSEIEKLKGNIRTSKKLIESYETRAGELNEKLREFGARIAEVQAELAKKSLEIAALLKNEEAAEMAHSGTQLVLERAKKVRENLLAMQDIRFQISELEARGRNLGEKIEFFDKEALEKKERIRKLEAKMAGTEFESLQQRCVWFESAYAGLAITITERTGEKDRLLKEIGQIENKLDRLSKLKEEELAIKNKKTYLEAVYKNAEALENTYLRIRADMRTRNIGALSALLNEMFDFMYSNNAYSHIELDPEYNLTVYRKDGIPLEPKLLSGGERAIFNLILRCAIYRLLALGFGGDRGMGLPPMMLDEPTVFLDRGHIQQLLKLIDMMRDIGVGQIIVVSHDESLIDSADHVFQVEKDPLTNTSSVFRK